MNPAVLLGKAPVVATSAQRSRVPVLSVLKINYGLRFQKRTFANNNIGHHHRAPVPVKAGKRAAAYLFSRGGSTRCFSSPPRKATPPGPPPGSPPVNPAQAVGGESGGGGGSGGKIAAAVVAGGIGAYFLLTGNDEDEQEDTAGNDAQAAASDAADVAANAATVIDDNVDAVAIEVEATEIVDGIEDEKQQADDALLVPVLAEAVPRATDSSDASEPTANPVVKKLTYAGIGVGIGSLVMLGVWALGNGSGRRPSA
eukprot:INCI661.1.p1 GENE.INCI661.1~~INCI661.1.p1  ORF type:complete len:256 (-),score=61.60 INCI661.1:601-1368(-)